MKSSRNKHITESQTIRIDRREVCLRTSRQGSDRSDCAVHSPVSPNCCCPSFRVDNNAWNNHTSLQCAHDSTKKKAKNGLFSSLRRRFSSVNNTNGCCSNERKHNYSCSSVLLENGKSFNQSLSESCTRCCLDLKGQRSRSVERLRHEQSTSSSKTLPRQHSSKKSSSATLPRRQRRSIKRDKQQAGANCLTDSEDEAAAVSPEKPQPSPRRRVKSRTSAKSKSSDLHTPFDGYGHASSPRFNEMQDSSCSSSGRSVALASSEKSLTETSDTSELDIAPATLTRDLRTVEHYDHVQDFLREPWSLTKELCKLVKCGWYWGPIDRLEAEEKLMNQPDGAFLVRDSSDERYLLTLSFRSFGRTLHTRIEHCNGVFSFYAQPDTEGYSSVEDLINHSMNNSYSDVFYYSRAPTPGSPSIPVRLLKPVSRFTQVRSLQYLCRFVIRQTTRVDHIAQLPLPNRIKGWLRQKQY